jgi:pullulanase
MAAVAGPARAQWLDSSHVFFKLAQGLHVFNEMRFVLAENTKAAQVQDIPTPHFDLPLLSSQNSYVTLSTSQLDKNLIDQLLQKPLKIYVTNTAGQILDSSALQFSGLLNQEYYYDKDDLGILRNGGGFSVKLWAPTASLVRLHVYPRGDTDPKQPENSLVLTRDHGVWGTVLPARYANYYYLYEVTVFQPSTDQIETSLATDPYSFGLSVNGEKSQIVDPADANSKPPDWDQLQKPVLNSLKDAVIYEMHIRDFTVADDSMPAMFRGTFMAFTQDTTKSMQHLGELAKAGLTHVHLMPFNDFGSVNEDKSQWQNFMGPSNVLEEPQNIIGRMRFQDPYNWGYDPVHYFTPEGSYAVQIDGASRIKEVRTMVQALAKKNLRLVQDVIFNHTYKNGLQPYSVFDKIVPLYYYRLNDEGEAFTTSCCADTASENRMMEKLMVDAVVYWAKTFKIDGFRFDLMSFHTHDTMIHIREALRNLSLAKDGVDGSKILIFGEGWLFGSLYDQAPQTSMNILNSYGLGIGLFNDRLRDAARGGTTNAYEKADQGFITGLFYDFNQEPANRDTSPDLGVQREKLLYLGDVIKAGLAGNLRDYLFRDHNGGMTKAYDIRFRGEPTATASQAIETINYVSAHDGYTLWDAIQAKAPFYTPGREPRLTSLDEKQRMVQMALALPLLGQGIPFVEAGSELLRSKCGDQDGYDSGDYFNRISWTGTDSTWGDGLPPVWKNFEDWNFWRPRLSDPGMKVGATQISATKNYFLALLRLRSSEPLFKLNSFNDISGQVSFVDNDAQNEPGLIAMHLHDGKTELLVLFNANRESRVFTHPLLQKNWILHPLLDEKVDAVLKDAKQDTGTKSIFLPGRSTVVLKVP